MFKETPPGRVDVQLGDVAINTEPVTSGTTKERSWEITGDLTLPAGAYTVHVRHVDPSMGEITVNDQAIGYGRYYERSSREDLVNKTQDFTPEVVIDNPDGKRIAISVSYPSSSPVNPDLL